MPGDFLKASRVRFPAVRSTAVPAVLEDPRLLRAPSAGTVELPWLVLAHLLKTLSVPAAISN